MDGTERIVLHSHHLAWPNGLTMDYTTHMLYWIDAKVLTIESSFMDGSNRRPIRTVGLRHPFALTMFENSLYWTDWQRKAIYTTKKFARSFTRLDGLLFNETLGFVNLMRENRTYTEVCRRNCIDERLCEIEILFSLSFSSPISLYTHHYSLPACRWSLLPNGCEGGSSIETARGAQPLCWQQWWVSLSLSLECH